MDLLKVDKVCRLCLKETEDLEPIFGLYKFEGVPILNIIMKVCYSIRLIPDETNSLPNNVCMECLIVLQRAHTLNNVSVQSESKLNCLAQTIPIEMIKKENIDLEEKLKYEEEIYEMPSEDIDEALYDAFEAEIETAESSDDKQVTKKKKKIVIKKHQCSTCLKFFEKPSKLHRHEQTHDVNKKPFVRFLNSVVNSKF